MLAQSPRCRPRCGNGRGVPRVVLGDACLDLAHQVGADVGRLGEDAAADSHEEGQQ